MTLDWILQHPYEALVWLLGATTAVATAAHLAIPALAKWAETTPGDEDDILIATWGKRIDTVIAVLDVLRRVMPRVVVGPTTRTQPLASVAGRPTVPSLAPMKPLSAPPPIGMTIRPWPEPAVVQVVPAPVVVVPDVAPDKEPPT